MSTAVKLSFDPSAFATPTAASAEEVAKAINQQTTLVRAGVIPGGRLILYSTSLDPRAWIRLVVTGGVNLGFDDNADNDDPLAKETAAVAVTSASGFAPGSAVRLASRGHVAGAAAPGPVTDGSGIVIKADGAATGELVTFHTADFPDPAAVTAADLGRPGRQPDRVGRHDRRSSRCGSSRCGDGSPPSCRG